MKWWWDSQTKMSFMFCTGHNHAFNAKQWHGALNYVVLYWIQGHKRYKGIVLNKVHIVQWHGALDYVVHGGDLSSSHRTTHLPPFFQSCVCPREAFQKKGKDQQSPQKLQLTSSVPYAIVRVPSPQKYLYTVSYKIPFLWNKSMNSKYIQYYRFVMIKL